MTRHFYKHRVTGLVSSLNDSFAGAFGDSVFERVGAPEKAVAPKTETKAAAESPKTEAANPANTTDAPKEGDK